MKAKLLLLLGLPALAAASALAIYALEGAAEGGAFGGPGDGLWWTLATLAAAGYDGLSPATGAGRALGALLLAAGVALNALLVAHLSQRLVRFQSKSRRGMARLKLKNHTLICSDLPRFIESVLRDRLADAKPGSVVLVSHMDHHPMRDTPYEDLPWVHGYSYQEGALALASADKCAVAYVGFRDDSLTVMTVMQLENKTNGGAITLALIADRGTRKYLENCGCDYALNPFDIYVPLMVQAFRNQGAPSWIRHIILRDPEAPTLENHPVPYEHSGKRWEELVDLLRVEQDWALVGLVDPHGVVLPNPHARQQVGGSDRLLVLAAPKVAPQPGGDGGHLFEGSADIPPEGHLIVCSDQPAFIRRMLEELKLANLHDEVVVLSAADPLKDPPRLPNYRWIQSSSHSDEGLTLARAQSARAAFIDHAHDSHTLMAVLRLEHLTGGSIFTVASYREPEFDKRLRDAGCDFSINAEELVAPLLTQSSRHYGLGILVEQVISQDPASDTLQVRRLAEGWRARTWQEAVAALKREQGCTAVGLIKMDGTHLYPFPAKGIKVEPGDHLLLLHRSGAELPAEVFERDPLASASADDSEGGGAVNELELERYRELAGRGNAKAMFNLGAVYEGGLGVHPNPRAAAEWFQGAAKQGHVRAMYRLGVLLYQGRGVEANAELARQWFKRAADQGHAQARKALQSLKELGGDRAGHELLDKEFHGKLSPAQRAFYFKAVIRMILIDGKIDYYEKDYLREVAQLGGDAQLVREVERAILFGEDLKLPAVHHLTSAQKRHILRELVDIAVVDRDFSEVEAGFVREVGNLMVADPALVQEAVAYGRKAETQYLKREP